MIHRKERKKREKRGKGYDLPIIILSPFLNLFPNPGIQNLKSYILNLNLLAGEKYCIK